MTRTESKRVRAGDKYCVKLHIDARILRAAQDIEELPESVEYWELQRKGVNMYERSVWFDAHYDEFSAKVGAIYKREGVRTVKQRNAVDDARTMLRMAERYG